MCGATSYDLLNQCGDFIAKSTLGDHKKLLLRELKKDGKIISSDHNELAINV